MQRVLSTMNRVGVVLILQLLSALVSLLIVTSFPAAIAMQRTLSATDAAAPGAHTGIMHRYFAEFRTAMRVHWRWGLIGVVVAIGMAVALLFWTAAQGPIAIIALCVLVPLAGCLVAVHLGALASAPTTAATSNRDLLRAAVSRVMARPLAVAACVVVIGTWLLLLNQVPTLIPITSFAIPAVLATWLRPETQPAVP